MKYNLNALNTYQIEYTTNDSSEINLKFGEYQKISEKDLIKLCQKLEYPVKTEM